MTAMRQNVPAAILTLLAGLFAVAGLALSALASHGALGGNSALAATLLLIHAPALLAISIAVATGYFGRVGVWGGAGIALGMALFTGDLVVRAVIGHALFPYAAPIGAQLAMLGWLIIGLSGFGKKADPA